MKVGLHYIQQNNHPYALMLWLFLNMKLLPHFKRPALNVGYATSRNNHFDNVHTAKFPYTFYRADFNSRIKL